MANEIDKLEEILYRTRLKSSFEKDIQTLRRLWFIPLKGSGNEREWRKNNLDSIKDEAFWHSILLLAKKHQLPGILYPVLATYLIEGKINNSSLRISSISCAIEQSLEAITVNGLSPMENMLRESGTNYIKLLIFSNSTLADVKRYLNRNWKIVQGLRIHQGQKIKTKFRVGKNHFRDDIIYQYYLKTREELGLKKGDYKEIAIAKKMKEDHAITVTSDAIKQIIVRQRKMRAS